MNEKERRDRIRGSLFAGAIGDALGYPVEFLGENEISMQYFGGIRDYCIDPASGKALVSDDTQMALFTANGILLGDTQAAMCGTREAPYVHAARAYREWLYTQRDTYPEQPAEDRQCWLSRVPQLYACRAPGTTCLTALEAQRDGGAPWSIEDPRNHSKGCGGVMRTAPMALAYDGRGPIPIEYIDYQSAQMAAVTHSHSLGYMPSAVLAHILNRIVYPERRVRSVSLEEIVLEARDTVSRLFAGDKHLPALCDIIDRAVELSKNSASDLENIHALGEGWVAEETLGIALYCALKYRDDLTAGVVAAVNHKGDSDSTGAVTGYILGALCGYEGIEKKWKRDLELADVILELADDLCPDRRYYHSRQWMQKYAQGRRAEPDVAERIEIRQTNIAALEADCIVNAANSALRHGGGVCGAIFSAAGPEKLADACDEIGFCAEGSAVITPGFDLPAQYIIHTVGPVWEGGEDGEKEKLYSCYRESLRLAKEHGCRSMGTPLISSGIFGYPKEEAWYVALRAVLDFMDDNSDWPITVIFTVIAEDSLRLGREILAEMLRER